MLDRSGRRRTKAQLWQCCTVMYLVVRKTQDSSEHIWDFVRSSTIPVRAIGFYSLSIRNGQKQRHASSQTNDTTKTPETLQHDRSIGRSGAEKEKEQHQRHRHYHSRRPDTCARRTLLVVPPLWHAMLIFKETEYQLRGIQVVSRRLVRLCQGVGLLDVPYVEKLV